jgi:hypothetical protein
MSVHRASRPSRARALSSDAQASAPHRPARRRHPPTGPRGRHGGSEELGRVRRWTFPRIAARQTDLRRNAPRNVRRNIRRKTSRGRSNPSSGRHARTRPALPSGGQESGQESRSRAASHRGGNHRPGSIARGCSAQTGTSAGARVHARLGVGERRTSERSAAVAARVPSAPHGQRDTGTRLELRGRDPTRKKSIARAARVTRT